MNYLDQLNTKPNKLLRFENYFNSQSELLNLSFEDYIVLNKLLVISGNSGSGVTHVLNALCNKYLNQDKNVLFISSQWILHIKKLLKSEFEIDLFFENLSKFDVIAIDNMQ